MIVEFQGGKSVQVSGKENLCLQVTDAETGEVLRQLPPPGSHQLTMHTIDLDGLADKQLHLVLIDRSTETSFAWIGLRSVRIPFQ